MAYDSFLRLAAFNRRRQRLDDVAHRFAVAQAHRLALEANQIEGFRKRLEALNPLQVLERGYAVVTRQADEN